MDVEGLLQSVIRFSNFMTSRLIVAGVVFYVASGFTDIGSASEGFLPDMELVNRVVENYQNISTCWACRISRFCSSCSSS